MRLAGSERLYVADLDAIAGAPADVETLRRLRPSRSCGSTRGTERPPRRRRRSVRRVARNVIGTESLSDAGYEAAPA